jgi:hypothetical protein
MSMKTQMSMTQIDSQPAFASAQFMIAVAIVGLLVAIAAPYMLAV